MMNKPLLPSVVTMLLSINNLMQLAGTFDHITSA